MNKNLVIVDYQNDFIDIKGSLNCGKRGPAIENNIVDKIREYQNENLFVTFDTHVLDEWDEEKKSPEGRIHPKHCIANTWGHNLYNQVGINLDDKEYIKIYKNSYGTDKIGKKIIEKNNCDKKVIVEFCGVSTDMCVFNNIVVLYNQLVTNNIDFEIIVTKSCVAAFDEEAEKKALDYLENALGVTIK